MLDWLVRLEHPPARLRHLASGLRTGHKLRTGLPGRSRHLHAGHRLARTAGTRQAHPGQDPGSFNGAARGGFGPPPARAVSGMAQQNVGRPVSVPRQSGRVPLTDLLTQKRAAPGWILLLATRHATWHAAWQWSNRGRTRSAKERAWQSPGSARTGGHPRRLAYTGPPSRQWSRL